MATRKKNFQKNGESIRDLWENINYTNINIVGVPGEEREQENENLFEEIMTEIFPNMAKEIHI